MGSLSVGQNVVSDIARVEATGKGLLSFEEPKTQVVY
jgi:hypothetical protein